MTEKLNLWQRMSNVMTDIGYLQKDDHVKFNTTNYKAISEEKVTMAVRKALIKWGLIILPINQEHRKDGNLTTVDISYKIMNIDKPEEFEIVVSSGTGADTQDKGVGKAMTYAYKYMLLRTFAIPTGEDPDRVSSAELDEKEKKAKEKQMAPPKNQAPPPKTPPKKDSTLEKMPPQTPSTINQVQQKQLFAIAGNEAKVVKDILLKHNLTQTKEILLSDYESYCKEVEEAYRAFKKIK
jgi:hypothetical protein